MQLLVEKKKETWNACILLIHLNLFVKNSHQDHKDETSVSWIILLSKTKWIWCFIQYGLKSLTEPINLSEKCLQRSAPRTVLPLNYMGHEVFLQPQISPPGAHEKRNRVYALSSWLHFSDLEAFSIFFLSLDVTHFLKHTFPNDN